MCLLKMLYLEFLNDLKNYMQLSSKGKPDKIEPLMNSRKPKITENNKIEVKILLGLIKINK